MKGDNYSIEGENVACSGAISQVGTFTMSTEGARQQPLYSKNKKSNIFEERLQF